jgi:hypothetical protein
MSLIWKSKFQELTNFNNNYVFQSFQPILIPYIGINFDYNSLISINISIRLSLIFCL